MKYEKVINSLSTDLTFLRTKPPIEDISIKAMVLARTANFLSASFLLRSKGVDHPYAKPPARSEVMELYGEELMDFFKSMSSVEAKHTREMETNRFALKMVGDVIKTLKSPIDDADKVSHLTDLFTEGNVQIIGRLLDERFNDD